MYRSRFERARGDGAAARSAAEAALVRATDATLANPFDEILARRALAGALEAPAAAIELLEAHRIAERTGNVLQAGIALYELAAGEWGSDRAAAAVHLDAAEARFTAARAKSWLRRARALRRGRAAPRDGRRPQ